VRHHRRRRGRSLLGGGDGGGGEPAGEGWGGTDDDEAHDDDALARRAAKYDQQWQVTQEPTVPSTRLHRHAAGCATAAVTAGRCAAVILMSLWAAVTEIPLRFHSFQNDCTHACMHSWRRRWLAADGGALMAHDDDDDDDGACACACAGEVPGAPGCLRADEGVPAAAEARRAPAHAPGMMVP
jgi:hypothetical protein